MGPIAFFGCSFVLLASQANGSYCLPNVDSLTTACAFKQIYTFAMGRGRACLIFGTEDAAEFAA